LTGSFLPDGGQQPLFTYDDLVFPLLTGTVGVGVATEGGSWQVRFDEALVASIDSAWTAAPEEGEIAAPLAPASPRLRVYPVPFRPTLTIEFELPRPQATTVAIYAVDGRRIATLLEERRPAARQRIFWNGRDQRGRPVPSGVYFCRLEAGGRAETRKVVRLQD
jgi:hypothetical protein